MSSPERLHATAVAIAGRGVLLRGAPGAGKSDLAVRLIAAGATLVADDQVELTPSDGVLLASPPAEIAGLIELRGVGIRRLPWIGRVPVALLVDLVASAAVERLPELGAEALAGICIPRLALAPFEASAAAKLVLALTPDAAPGAAGAGRAVGYNGASMSAPGPSPRIPDDAGHGPAGARVILITGMSGAGRSTALKLLEDMGYEAVDNLPLSLLPRLVAAQDEPHPIAVGIDIRTRDFAVSNVLGRIERLIASQGLDCRLVFLDCDDECLARRYTETRRRHPLAGDRPVIDGIRLERVLVSPLRGRADLVVDTSSLKTGELKRLLAGHFGLNADSGLKVFVTSFSFRLGLPREADLVFDVRFLENPHYVPELRPLTGLDLRVGAAIAADPSWAGFFASLTGLLEPLLPRYVREGKSYLTIAIGCTGGRHRSVYAAERLAEWLASLGETAQVAHRDLDRPVNPQDLELPPAARAVSAVP